MHNLFLVYYVNLYMFRAYLGQLSGGTTVCIQQLVLIILFRITDCCPGWIVPIQPGQQSGFTHYQDMWTHSSNSETL